MGLKLSLKKEDNYLYCDFVDAYWKINGIMYNTTSLSFELACYPTRESSKKDMEIIGSYSLPIGGSDGHSAYSTKIYKWEGITTIADVFPSGIPLSEDEQKTAIYNWVKKYTGLPFEDVFEE